MNLHNSSRENKLRLFLALNLSEPIKKQLTEWIQILKPLGPDIRWIHPNQMHLTLRFLGQVSETTLPHIFEIMKSTTSCHQRFECQVGGIGAFPNWINPQVLWVGVKKGTDEIKGLACDLDSHFSQLGYEPHRNDFIPHVTLARLKNCNSNKDLNDKLEELNRTPFDSFQMESICLYKSILQASGSEYHLLEESNF